jgi:hypothetical protein
MKDHEESFREEYLTNTPMNASTSVASGMEPMRFTKKKASQRTGRHGARNQHRHKHLAKWMLQTFPQLSDTTQHVLDVAGGKGELAARLCFCHRLSVVMVDPRKSDIASCFESVVLPKLPKKWQQRLEVQRQAYPQFLEETTAERFRQLVTTFDETTLSTCHELQNLVQNASLLVGMHADGATEAIVDAALEHAKPFVVVPCCVFPRLFSERTIQQDGITVQVRTHEQFCQYLLEKDPRFVREVLPFEGRNVAIWWGGNCPSSSSETPEYLQPGRPS